MRNQHEAQVGKEERQAKPVEEKNMPSSQSLRVTDWLISLSAKEWITSSLVVKTMNPSTEDFVKAVEELNARNIIILPNNKIS